MRTHLENCVLEKSRETIPAGQKANAEGLLKADRIQSRHVPNLGLLTPPRACRGRVWTGHLIVWKQFFILGSTPVKVVSGGVHGCVNDIHEQAGLGDAQF